jgi:ribonuclease HII
MRPGPIANSQSLGCERVPAEIPYLISAGFHRIPESRSSYTDCMAGVCGWKLEKAAAKCGFLRVAGCDEVGRGPMFGPVVAAAVVLPLGCRIPGLNDSKQLAERRRNELDVIIRAKALAFAIAAIDVETIDRVNIRRASLLAMRTAVEQLGINPDYLLIDGCDTIDWPCPQESVIHGDARSYSIAAASVLAKVYRDRMLVELDAVYPGYGLAKHKGYCSREHLAALDRLGPTPMHRKNWSPVAQTMLDFPEEVGIAVD